MVEAAIVLVYLGGYLSVVFLSVCLGAECHDATSMPAVPMHCLNGTESCVFCVQLPDCTTSPSS